MEELFIQDIVPAVSRCHAQSNGFLAFVDRNDAPCRVSGKVVDRVVDALSILESGSGICGDLGHFPVFAPPDMHVIF